jgi:hypothetical protein
MLFTTSTPLVSVTVLPFAFALLPKARTKSAAVPPVAGAVGALPLDTQAVAINAKSVTVKPKAVNFFIKTPFISVIVPTPGG